MTSLLPTLYKALELRYNQPREGVHVSDLLYCPRESVFKRLQPKPVDNTQLGFFTSGKAIGEAIQVLAQTYPDQFVPEYEVHFEGLQAHIDLMDTKNGVPIECKSFNGTDMEQPKEHYVQQIKFYMALTNSQTGIILVQILQHFKSKKQGRGVPFKEWVISMTQEQLDAEKAKLHKEKESFERALNEKNPALARHVMGTDEAFKCNHCKYLLQCQEINKQNNVFTASSLIADKKPIKE